jgi:hypothetical protein
MAGCTGLYRKRRASYSFVDGAERGWCLARLVRLDRQKVAQNVTLLAAVLAAVFGRIEHLLALSRGHIPQLAETPLHRLFAIRWELPQLLCSAAHLLPFGWAQPLHVFDAVQRSLPLLRRHRVKLLEMIQQPLLLWLGQTAEPGFLLQRPLLIADRLILMPG